MKRLVGRISFLLLAFILQSFGLKAVTAQVGLNPPGYDFSGLRSVLQGAVSAAAPRGAAVMVTHRNRTVFREAYGIQSNGAPFTTQTRVAMASSTKALSMAAIMICVDRGLVSLDDPVGNYIPAFRNLPVRNSTRLGNPTLRQCMSFTAGMEGDSSALQNTSITMEQAVAQIALENTPLRAEPGLDFYYGGVSMQVAARVAEIVTGTPFDTWIRQNLFIPCRMTNTAFTVSGDFIANPRVAGGSYSTLDDYTNFLRMFYAGGVFDGRRVLSENSVRAMRTDQTSGAQITYSPYQAYGQPGTRYGFGLWLNVTDGNGLGINISDGGAFGTMPWIDYRSGTIGVFLVQSLLGAIFPLTETVRMTADTAIRQATPPGPNRATGGVFRPANGYVYLKNQNSSGFADKEFFYGTAGDTPIAGDWDGDGVRTVGIYRNGVFYLKNSNTSGFADLQFPFGVAGDIPVSGDWNGDGIDTVGVYRVGRFLLRNTNDAGFADLVIPYGIAGDFPVIGDWDGDGFDGVGIYRDGIFFLRNSATPGFADFSFPFGMTGDLPIIGDWNGDSRDSIGVYRNGQFLLKDLNEAGFADQDFFLGVPGDLPIAGDWDGNP